MRMTHTQLAPDRTASARGLARLSRRYELYAALTIVALCALVQLRSGQFLSANNLVDIVVSMIVPAMFGMCALIVIVSGGIDVSFTAVASLSMFATTKILLSSGFSGGVFWAFAFSALFGLILGAFNGAIIALFNLPTLIVTLGTQSVFMGILQGALNAQEIADVPKAIFDFGNARLFVATNAVSGLTSNLSSSVLILFGVVVLTFFLLRYTIWGRGVYAIGGDPVSAVRAGFPVKWIKFSIYCLVGLMAGIAGMTRVCMMQNCQPTNLIGMELLVIASVVLGGASITGGSGTITGVLLGTALITIMSNSLLLLGIPSYWQNFFTGLLIIVGTGISAFQVLARRNRLPKILDA
jgi:simple sugar transport system permease protein